MVVNQGGFDEEANYDAFPAGADNGYGPDEGYNAFTRLNNPALFTDEAREDPVIQAFLNAPFSFTFAVFKSSTRESEWMLHKPHKVFRGEVDGIEGGIDGFPDDDAHAQIGTFVINHDRTMARWKWFALVAEDGARAGMMIYKQEDTSQETPGFGEGV
ncbi:MAG TPA: hypothetical protein VFW95_01795 [Candidatus Limnocylindria bacterium]|nr:hypothetical protein [Candidatus Limnocylindria bacterium]